MKKITWVKWDKYNKYAMLGIWESGWMMYGNGNSNGEGSGTSGKNHGWANDMWKYSEVLDLQKL
ncbi:hypothetical protein CR513_27818, partial [Mucuna pruriens]